MLDCPQLMTEPTYAARPDQRIGGEGQDINHGSEHDISFYTAPSQISRSEATPDPQPRTAHPPLRAIALTPIETIGASPVSPASF